jgi:hypothetical protein
MRVINVFQMAVVAVLLVSSNTNAEESLNDVFSDMYDSCLSRLSFDCVQPKALAWISKAVHKREIRLTDDLTIVQNNAAVIDDEPDSNSGRDVRYEFFNKIDKFLLTHSLSIRYPKALIQTYVPSFAVSTVNELIPEGIQVPLTEKSSEGRSLVKKVLIPFVLGLKFKTTVLLPLAFALIALKAWKALTLGLLSLVVSAAVVVFKLAKPKVVNYEVVHYPHHYEHPHHFEHHQHLEHIHPHIDVHPVPHIDHVHPVPHIEHSHDIAYSAHL